MSSKAVPKRRWVLRFVIGLLVVVWLSVSLLVSTADPVLGIALFVAGAVYVGSELWLARNWERHPTAAAIWKVALHLSLAGVFISFGVGHFGWLAILFFVYGAWSLAMGLLVAAALWVERRRGEERL